MLRNLFCDPRTPMSVSILNYDAPFIRACITSRFINFAQRISSSISDLIKVEQIHNCHSNIAGPFFLRRYFASNYA